MTEQVQEELKTEVPEVEQEEAVETPEVPAVETSLDDIVKSAFEQVKKPEVEAPAAEVKTEEPKKPVDVYGREQEPINVPASMPPALAEKWGTVPREMQQYWRDRERDIATQLTKTAEERKLAASFRDTVKPFEKYLEGTGKDALSETRDLFMIGDMLKNGTSVDKARIADQIIRTYLASDPEAMKAFGQFAMGTPPAAPPPNVRAEIERYNKEQEAIRVQETGKTSVERFATDPKNTHFNTVKGTMKSLIDGGVATGADVDTILVDAYQKALKLHSLETPAAAPAVTAPTPNKTVKPSIAAVKTAPKGPAVKQSLDDIVKEAFKSSTKR